MSLLTPYTIEQLMTLARHRPLTLRETLAILGEIWALRNQLAQTEKGPNRRFADLDPS